MQEFRTQINSRLKEERLPGPMKDRSFSASTAIVSRFLHGPLIEAIVL